MKRIVRSALMAIVAALCALANLSAQDGSKQINVMDMRQEIASGSYAIVVGINDYLDDEICDLSYCEKDAREFRDALVKNGGYTDASIKLYLGNDASFPNVMKAIKNLKDARVPQNSTILFYFSGHGFAHEGKNYIIPYDGTADPDYISQRNINLEEVESLLAASAFGRQLIFIDACRNQVTTGGKDVGVKGFAETALTVNAKGMKVFLGTEFGCVSRESEDLKSGVFTHYLIEGITGGGDQNRDGIVTIGELELFVSTSMENQNIGSNIVQRPVSRGEGSPLIPVAARQGEFTETTTGGSTTGGTVEAVTPAGAGTTASGFGTLKLTVGIDGVQCYIDGALKGSSAAGAITVENLSPGEHTIKLVKEGYETREFKAQVFAGQIIEKSLNFSKISGIIRVTLNAYPFHIYLDGAYITLSQTASYDITDVSYGAHTVVLKKSGYADAEYKVTITGSAPVAVQAALTRVYGQLTVITNPSGATVKITSSDDIVVSAGFNGKSFASGAEASASEPLNLTPGSYTVTISKDGYETITKTVTIATNAPAVIDVELKKKTQPITPPPTTGGTKPPTIVPTTVDWSKGARKVVTLRGHKDDVKSVAFSPDGRYALTGSDDYTAKLWNLPSGTLVKTLSGHDGCVNSVAISPDGRYALTGSFDSTSKIWSIPDGKCVTTLRAHKYAVSSVAISYDGRYALTGSYDNTAKLWSIPEGSLIKTLIGHTWGVHSVAFSVDGRFALTGSEDKTARIWSVAEGACIRTFTGHTNRIFSVAFSPDGQYALTGSDDKTAKLWSVAEGACIRTFTGHTYPVYPVAFSPDGQYALTGSDDKTAKLWSIANGSCIRTFIGHTDGVESVAFSPNGEYALTGSYDKTAKLWSVADGACIKTFTGHTSYVRSVAFSPDGQYALTGSWDTSVMIYDIAKGAYVQVEIDLTKIWVGFGVYEVKFSPDGQYIIAVGDNYVDEKNGTGYGAILLQCGS